jgi:hypothetical protein
MKTLIGKLVVLALGVLTIGVFAGRAQIMNQLDFKMDGAAVYCREYHSTGWGLHNQTGPGDRSHGYRDIRCQR